MQIFDGFNAPTKARSAGARGAFLLPIAASLVLAACGGGSSGGGVQPPPPVVCTATDGGGSGFALGVCTDTVTAAFQPANATVVPSASPSYELTLTAPATLPQIRLTSANRTPVGTRDIIGELRGEAYEADADLASDPQHVNLVAPYAALIDFRTAWRFDQSQPDATNALQAMTYASFGVWERFATTSYADGYFGGWYAAWPSAVLTTNWPTGARSYTGLAVGVISPSNPASAVALPQARSYGFSATVTIDVDSTGKILESSRITGLRIATSGTGFNLTIGDVPLDPIAFVWGSTNAVNQPVSGALVGTGGANPDSTGSFEASFYGSNDASGEAGVEMAGRFSFETGNGLRAVGAFGAVRSSGP